MPTLQDFKPGQTIELVYKSRNGVETRAAVISFVNYNNLGGITFAPGPGATSAGSGWFDPATVGTTPFGLIEARIVRQAPVGYGSGHHWQPAPGDRGYDLMC